MARQLAASVHVHEETGTTVYQEGDVPPAKHAALITNESAWDPEYDEPSEEELAAKAEADKQAKDAAAKAAASKKAGA